MLPLTVSFLVVLQIFWYQSIYRYKDGASYHKFWL